MVCWQGRGNFDAIYDVCALPTVNVASRGSSNILSFFRETTFMLLFNLAGCAHTTILRLRKSTLKCSDYVHFTIGKKGKVK